MPGDYHGYQAGTVTWTAKALEDRVTALEDGAIGRDGLPEVPATPTAQDVVDALIALGLVTQAS